MVGAEKFIVDAKARHALERIASALEHQNSLTIEVERDKRALHGGAARPEEDGVVEEPVDSGFYRYSGGDQAMLFHLDERGNWHAWFSNEPATVHPCTWGYIDQALSVWKLVKI